MDRRFLQGRDQSSKRKVHPRSIRNGAFELQEIPRRSERLAGVVSATEGKTKEKSRREREVISRRRTRKTLGTRERRRRRQGQAQRRLARRQRRQGRA